MAWKLNLDSMIVIFRFHNFSEIFNFSVASKHSLSYYFREVIHWDKKEFFSLNAKLYNIPTHSMK